MNSERKFPHEVILSRSRYLAPATQSLRFYREYFKPVGLSEIEKDRYRYLIEYKDTEFFVNLDEVTNPETGQIPRDQEQDLEPVGCRSRKPI